MHRDQVRRFLVAEHVVAVRVVDVVPMRIQHALREGADNPERFLAIAVIARWLDDLGTTRSSVIDEAWADLAGVPLDWLERFDHNLGARSTRVVHG